MRTREGIGLCLEETVHPERDFVDLQARVFLHQERGRAQVDAEIEEVEEDSQGAERFVRKQSPQGPVGVDSVEEKTLLPPKESNELVQKRWFLDFPETVPITVLGDTSDEPDEWVPVHFTNPTNATIGGYGLGFGLIRDDD